MDETGLQPVSHGERPAVTFIVPALNEELNLPPLFERLLSIQAGLGVPCEILVIDDSSDDRTLAVAREAGASHPQIRSFHKPLPHGLGLGVRSGIDLARGRAGIVVMADGVDPLEDAVPMFCDKILGERFHLALLSRYTAPEDSHGIPGSYKTAHVLFRFFTSWFLGIPFRDTTYAFRAFDIDFMRGLNLRSTGFEISPETTFRTFFAGGRIAEVPGRQTRRVHGVSNFRFSKTAPGYGRVLGQAWLMRLGLVGKPVVQKDANL